MSIEIILVQKSSQETLMVMRGGNIPVAMANAIRRTMLSEIPVVAIDTVDISHNTGPLHNEYVSHRMKIVPVVIPLGVRTSIITKTEKMPGGKVSQRRKPKQELLQIFCDQHKFSIDVKGSADGITEVTTNQFKQSRLQDDGSGTFAELPPQDTLFPSEFLITKLQPNKEDEEARFACTFKIKCGTAKQHAKWQAINIISYRYLVPQDEDILIRAEKEDNPQKWLSTHLNYDQLSLKEEQTLKHTPGFLFYLEQASIPVHIVLLDALEILVQKVDKFETTFAKFCSKKDNVFQIDYENETHTLGNLLSSYGLLMHPDAFIGYRIVHPLQEKFILRCTLPNAVTTTDIEEKKFITAICQTIKADILKISAQIHAQAPLHI